MANIIKKQINKVKSYIRKTSYAHEVMEATGWDREKALSEMEKAKQVGMPYFRYVKNKCWELNLEEIESLNEKIKKQKAEKKRKEERKKKKENYIDEVMEATGWDREKALSEMEKAKQVGMPYFRYVKNKCWELNLEEIESLNEKIKEQKAEKKRKEEERKENCIHQVMEATGWEREKAIKELEQALHLGISNYQYAFKYLFQLTPEELQEFSRALKEKKKASYRDNKFYVDMVCLKTGWDTDKARQEMKNAKKAGVSYLKYIQKQLWDSNNKEQVISGLVKDKDRMAKNRNTYVEKICEKTGWSRGKTELEVLKAKINCGASYEDYLVFRFYEKSPEEQREYVTLGLFNKMRIKYNDYYKSTANFDNKVAFNTNFKDYINHKWFFNQDLSYEKFSKSIEGLNKIIVKPLAATQGLGVEVHQCNLNESDNMKLYQHIVQAGQSIVEEYIVQHDEISKFCKSTVNTIRVTTLNFNGDCKFLYSVFRIGKEGAAVDNFHAGGIAATIDMETGTVVSNAADLAGNIFTHSPSTGQKIKGFQIPHWDLILSTCREITGLMEGTNLVGWDFAITEKGVDLIEGNPGASYIVAQIPNVEENIGIADKMVYPYLDASITGMDERIG